MTAKHTPGPPSRIEPQRGPIRRRRGIRAAAPQLVIGAILLSLGLLLLLDRFAMVRFQDFWRLWPLIVIGVGVSNLSNPKETGYLRRGWTLIFFGGWFLINSFEIFGLDWGTTWPLALVALGSGRLIGGTSGSERRRGAFFVVLGLGLQVVVLGLFGLELEETWPLVLVVVGIWIFLTAFARRPGAKEEKRDEPS